MRNAYTLSLLAGLSLFAGCSGGSTDDTASARIKCIGGQSFCIISCDLGCTQTGCSVSEIAENQKLRFKFSDLVEPASVNGASFSIRTATGVAPEGDYLVNGSEVVFAPRVSTSNGVSTFGFLRNESYIITVLGGNSGAQGIKSLAGDTLTQEFTCTVRASLGIQDDDQQPPTVELVAPVSTNAIPLDPTIVLRFSELIDTTALQSPLSAASPVRVVLRGTLPGGSCDRDAEGIALEGLPSLSTENVNGRDVTVVTYQPPVTLPGTSCLTVYVTSDLRDLSGRAAIPRQFEMLTVAGVSTPINFNESFANSAGQVALVSGGVWNNGARPGLIGGDGRHGSFKPQNGVGLGNSTYEWNVDNFTIPGANTPSGNAFTVTDGRFYFTDFVVPEGITVKFVGSVPAQIFVRGQVDLRGTIDVSAADMPHVVPTSGPLANQHATNRNCRTPQTGNGVNGSTVQVEGQPGGPGGCGGAAGGAGGRECLGAGAITVNGVVVTDGQSGGGVRVLASHAYAAQAANTGGRGSAMHPFEGTSTIANNLTIQVGTINPGTGYRARFTAGGGGGGFMLAGAQHATTPIPTPSPLTNANNPGNQANYGPVPPAAVAFPLLPLPVAPPAGYQSLDHFLVGGSGGGGGGSGCFGLLASVIANDYFMAGHGGSGGGGAVMLRCGGTMTIASTARLLAKGGAGVVISGDDTATTAADFNFGISTPGGGGSGGSFLLQSGRGIVCNGLLDTAGGAGSRAQGYGTITQPTQFNIVCQAGAGSHGFYRLEAAEGVTWNGLAATVPAFNAANNSGALNDRDSLSGDLSIWRSSNQVFPPVWLRYELEVDSDGNGTADLFFTDSGEAGTVKANDPNGPVVILFQGATMNQAGNAPLEGTIRAWREGVGTGAGPGIAQDSVTGFRFLLNYNRAAFPNQVVTALRVFART
ncbi:MAG: hypothetical protein JNK15_17980 [Planctomycetes bacterium]|nr:hypothetical protein [Planctomycetota bacterium]